MNILQTEAFRALLAPFGHITWTALLGGALFASSRGGRFHLTRRLVLTLLGVVTLHALWDQSYGWAVMMTNGLISNEGWHLLWPNAQFWIVAPTGEEMLWFNVFYNVAAVDQRDRRRHVAGAHLAPLPPTRAAGDDGAGGRRGLAGRRRLRRRLALLRLAARARARSEEILTPPR